MEKIAGWLGDSNVKRYLLILLPILSVMLSSCSAENVSEKKLFPDEYVRELAKAVVAGSTDAMDAAIAKGVDVNYVGKDDVTLLAWALVKGSKTGFEYLLKKGADPNARLGEYDTLLSMATNVDDPFFLEAALRYGGDPNQRLKSSVGEISLLWYTTSTPLAKPDMVRVLVKYGADADRAERDVVSGCAMQNNYENVYILLQAGASFPTNRVRYKLIERLENRAVHPDDPEYVWRNKVVSFLRERGIEVTPKEWKREDQPTIINVQTNLNIPR